jgi:hypothetical protein
MYEPSAPQSWLFELMFVCPLVSIVMKYGATAKITVTKKASKEILSPFIILLLVIEIVWL